MTPALTQPESATTDEAEGVSSLGMEAGLTASGSDSLSNVAACRRAATDSVASDSRALDVAFSVASALSAVDLPTVAAFNASRSLSSVFFTSSRAAFASLTSSAAMALASSACRARSDLNTSSASRRPDSASATLVSHSWRCFANFDSASLFASARRPSSSVTFSRVASSSLCVDRLVASALSARCVSLRHFSLRSASETTRAHRLSTVTAHVAPASSWRFVRSAWRMALLSFACTASSSSKRSLSPTLRSKTSRKGWILLRRAA
mmetsp:Transcript_62803/g.136535  ORF Transcript_62803/g.136535 Transcript_62803/m.136535 type:complete len:265 (-) Transcript_62803:547-1341(-)